MSTINNINEGTSPAVQHNITTHASVNTEIAAAASQTKGTTPPTNIMKHLRKAAGSKKPDVLPAFLKEYPQITLEDISDTKENHGRSALHMAAWTGHISNVSLLLDMGCDINIISRKPQNYGKSPIFFAATRSRKDVMNLLLDRGANVLIVNNKGQSVYSLSCSHFDSELCNRIKQIEIEQEDANKDKPLNGWVNYRESHSDGNIYGDLDLRFLGRELIDEDVVKEGVVNPTTKTSRKGNFARNNPHCYNSRKKSNDATKKKEKPRRTELTEEERIHLETLWVKVHAALQKSNAWEVFSSLLTIVQYFEDKKIQSRWVIESSTRLMSLLSLEADTHGELALDDANKPVIDNTSTNNLRSLLEEAIVFCGSGDRHVTLVKRILTKAYEGKELRQYGDTAVSETQSGGQKTETPSRQRRNDQSLVLPDCYHTFINSLQSSIVNGCKVPSWDHLMNSVDDETRFLSLPNSPVWIDSLQELQILEARLHDVIGSTDHDTEDLDVSFDKLVAFDSEFRSEDGNTKLATIQFSVLEDGIPLSWVVDLCPDSSNNEYSAKTCDLLRWFFLESDFNMLAFAPRHDIHMISSYIREEMTSSTKLWDLQLLSAHKMAGQDSKMSSLPGLKACCSYFLESCDVNGQKYELSKVEQCSDWSKRPLSCDQLEYAGLDASVLLVLLAEIVCKS